MVEHTAENRGVAGSIPALATVPDVEDVSGVTGALLLDLDRLPLCDLGADVVEVGAELDGELERDALNGDREREMESGSPSSRAAKGVDARAAGLDRVGDLGQTRGARFV